MNRIAPLAALTLASAAAHAQHTLRIIEDSGFFAAPGITLGAVGEFSSADPSAVTILGNAGSFSWGGLDYRTQSASSLHAFENGTNSLRALDASLNQTLVDSVGWLDPGTSGLAFNNDGTRGYATSAVSGFARLVEFDALTAEVISVRNFVNRTFSALAIMPEGTPFAAGNLWALQNTSGFGIRLLEIDLETDQILRDLLVLGIGFNAQFETGLDIAPDGTMYAVIQGFRQIDPDTFEEISSHLYTLDPATGQATDLGVIQADMTWDASGITVVPDDPACSPADVTTTGTSNGMPDGVVDVSDYSFYLTLWADMDPDADVTTTGTSNGTPDGIVDVSDFSFYLTLWAAGCP